MSKTNYTPSNIDEDDLLPEYDFSNGVRGKHHQTYQQGHSVTIHHPDDTTSTQQFPASRVVAKLTTEHQLTLPKSIIDQIQSSEYFDVKVEDGKIILTPVNSLGWAMPALST
jgi:hypothetical protein